MKDKINNKLNEIKKEIVTNYEKVEKQVEEIVDNTKKSSWFLSFKDRLLSTVNYLAEKIKGYASKSNKDVDPCDFEVYQSSKKSVDLEINKDNIEINKNTKNPVNSVDVEMKNKETIKKEIKTKTSKVKKSDKKAVEKTTKEVVKPVEKKTSKTVTKPSTKPAVKPVTKKATKKAAKKTEEKSK